MGKQDAGVGAAAGVEDAVDWLGWHAQGDGELFVGHPRGAGPRDQGCRRT